jgi:hypothetical protein
VTHEDFESIDIRKELRAARSQPDQEFVSALAGRLPRDRHRLRATPRVALAFAVTIVALSVAAAFGGISEAATAVGNAVSSIVNVGTAPTPQKAQFNVVTKKAAAHKAANSSVNASQTPSSSGSASHVGAFIPAPADRKSPSFFQYGHPCPRPPPIPHPPKIPCRFNPVP